jgi:hypothetical protein
MGHEDQVGVTDFKFAESCGLDLHDDTEFAVIRQLVVFGLKFVDSPVPRCFNAETSNEIGFVGLFGTNGLDIQGNSAKWVSL